MIMDKGKSIFPCPETEPGSDWPRQVSPSQDAPRLGDFSIQFFFIISKEQHDLTPQGRFGLVYQLPQSFVSGQAQLTHLLGQSLQPIGLPP